jgi:hypothetical protein
MSLERIMEAQRQADVHYAIPLFVIKAIDFLLSVHSMFKNREFRSSLFFFPLVNLCCFWCIFFFFFWFSLVVYEEGLFRKSGCATLIRQYKIAMDPSRPDSESFFEAHLDPHVVADLLKGFFRDLPTPFIKYD